MTPESPEIHSVSTVLQPVPGIIPGAAPPQSRITLDYLVHTYQTILSSQAIYYPVAYQLAQRLGQGRQGVVFMALRQGARGCITQHAIKLFDPSIYDSPEDYWTDMGRIASQTSRLQPFQSPYLVTRHSYEENYGIGYTEMEAIDGINVQDLLNERHLDFVKARSTMDEWSRIFSLLFTFEDGKLALRPGLAVYILRRILRGLEGLHSMSFLHCDVKPSNVMIDRQGCVKLVDFGRALMIGEKPSFLLGAPMYMAPETHRFRTLDVRADLYSAGLVGLEMLRGEPIADPSVVETEALLSVKAGLPGNLKRLLQHVSRHPDLLAAIGRLVNPDLHGRFAGAEEAEAGPVGLRVVDQHLADEDGVVDYERELSDYLAKLVDPVTRRIELPDS